MKKLLITPQGEQLLDYTAEEIVGLNCRFMQGEDREQEARYLIAAAMKEDKAVEVTLRNYRKDGQLFHNRLKIVPLFDKKQRVLYYLGVQYDITENVNAQKEIKSLTDLLNER
jgi:PAS domain S-box-containing protein